MLQSYHLRHLSRLKINTYKSMDLHCHYYSANKYTVCVGMNTERSHPAYPAHDSRLWYVTSCAGALWTSRSFKRGVDSRRRPAGSLADQECFIMTETHFNCISDFSDAVHPSVTHSKVPIHTKEDLRGWPSLGDKAWLVDDTGAQWDGGQGSVLAPWRSSILHYRVWLFTCWHCHDESNTFSLPARQIWQLDSGLKLQTIKVTTWKGKQ